VEFLGVTCERGSKARARVKVAELYDGTEITMPVRIVCGAKDGPTVTMTAMVHGDEFNGMAVINRLYEEVDPTELSGNLVGVPAANPLAFVVGKRISDFEYERLNLNRVFPGHAGGLSAERIAAALWDGMISRGNYHLDFHEGGRDFVARYIIAPEPEGADTGVTDMSKQMARWIGQGVPTLVSRLSEQRIRLGRGGTTTVQSTFAGKPALSIELGGGGRLWDEHVETGVVGTTNILKGLGMLPGELVGTEHVQHVASDTNWPRPNRGGLFKQFVELGDVVEKGQPVGVVTDIFGDQVEELYSPYKAVILDIRHWAPIMTGEWTVHCGRIE
jgi:predicted deacylase